MIDNNIYELCSAIKKRDTIQIYKIAYTEDFSKYLNNYDKNELYEVLNKLSLIKLSKLKEAHLVIENANFAKVNNKLEHHEHVCANDISALNEIIDFATILNCVHHTENVKNEFLRYKKENGNLTRQVKRYYTKMEISQSTDEINHIIKGLYNRKIVYNVQNIALSTNRFQDLKDAHDAESAYKKNRLIDYTSQDTKRYKDYYERTKEAYNKADKKEKHNKVKTKNRI